MLGGNLGSLLYGDVSVMHRQNISKRTTLNSTQFKDRSIIPKGTKLINLWPESPLFGRSDKVVRDMSKTKELVYRQNYLPIIAKHSPLLG